FEVQAANRSADRAPARPLPGPPDPKGVDPGLGLVPERPGASALASLPVLARGPAAGVLSGVPAGQPTLQRVTPNLGPVVKARPVVDAVWAGWADAGMAGWEGSSPG